MRHEGKFLSNIKGRQKPVNPLAYAFVGSSPTSPTSQPARNQESEFSWKEVGWLWLITDL